MRNKLKQLTKDTALYGLSTIVGRFLNFLLVPFYTNIFNPSDYGVISILYTFIALLNIFFLFGMDSAYLKYAGTADISERESIFKTSLFPVLAVDGFLILLILAGKSLLSSAFNIPVQHSYLWYYLAAILLVDSITALPYISLRLKKKAINFSLIRIANILFNITLNIILIVGLKKGIESVFISNLAASLLSLILLAPELFLFKKGTFNKDLLRKLFKFGLPYLPAGIASMFMQVIDRPIVEKLKGFETLGIYQANYRMGIFMMLFVSMFQFAWQPFFLENSKEEKGKELFSKVFTYFTAVGSIILVFLSLFVYDFATLKIGGYSLIGKAYWSGLSIIPVVLFAYLLNGFYINFSAGLFIKEKSIAFPLIMGIGAMINVVANFILIPQLDIMGAAISTLLSYLAMAIGFYFMSQKVFPIKYEWNKVSLVLLMVIIIGTVYYMNWNYLNSHNIIKIAMLLVFLASLFIFKIVSRHSLNLLLRKNIS